MFSIYFPHFKYFSADSLHFVSDHCIFTDLVYNQDVTIAIIRPPEVFSLLHVSNFPNLRYILSDTTGISHLLLASQYNHINVITLRDLSFTLLSS